MRLQPLGHLSCAEYQGSKNDSLANPARDFGSRLRYGETRLNIISEADQLAAGCAIAVDVGFFLLEFQRTMIKKLAIWTLVLSMLCFGQNEQPPRARDLGIKVGVLPTGPLNAIT
ncbi:MAG TPA: hypothetical protein VKE71_00115, partial [Candidatus Angelobacter sp.]|nr:hypothetical protein [Candidatus Angelobacter sp.]